MPKILGEPAVKFNLANNKKDTATVTALFRYSGKLLRYSPGLAISPKHWDKVRQRPRANLTQYAEARRELDNLADTMLNIWRETKGKIEVEAFKLEIQFRTGVKERPTQAPAILTLTDFAKEYIKQRLEDLTTKRESMRRLETVYGYLVKYAAETGREYTFDQIDHNFAHGFINWLYAAPREFSANFAARVISTVRQFMRESERRKLHTNSSYQDFKVKQEKVTHLALTRDELQLLVDLELENDPRLDKVRDLFLIGCFTGLRYSDFSRIEPAHMIDDDGEKMIELVTQKTGQVVVIPFTDELGRLLEKYNYNPPKMSSQRMNDYLKELCKLAGLNDTIRIVTNRAGQRVETDVAKWELVTTHVARRSFATNMYVQGIPAVSIMKITGHATEKQFMQYIQIDGRQNARQMAARLAQMTGRRHLRKVE